MVLLNDEWASWAVARVVGYLSTEDFTMPTQRDHRGTRRSYGGNTRTLRTSDLYGGYRVESWSLGAQSPPFDAEVAALVRAIEICTLDAEEGRLFRIITDSQAAMRRMQDDQPGAGQSLAGRASG